MSTEQNDLIPQTDSWLVRQSTTRKMNKKTDMPNNEERVELVWGHRERKRNRSDVETLEIVGEVHHELSGPTALKSIQEMAERMNRTGQKPLGPKPKTIADGFKPKFNQQGGESLFSPQILKETISYKPNAKRI